MKNQRLFLVTLPRIGVIIVLTLFMLSMMTYSGGTIINPDAVGHDFARNFLSDLGKFSANNLISMILFMGALTIVGALFSGYFYYFMTLYPLNSPLGWLVRISCISGIFGALCFAGVGFTPHNIALTPHIFFVNWAFRAFFFTSVLMSITVFKDQRFLYRYGVGYTSFAVLIFLYILILEFGPDPKASDFALMFSVIAQKIIILVFMLSVLFQTVGNSKLLALKSTD